MQIVVLDGYTLNPGDNPWDALGKLGDLVVYDRTSASELFSRAKNAEILIVNKQRLERESIAALPNLKLICVTATGFDCVDVSAARTAGIPVCNVPVYGTSSVAQFVIAQLLTLCHQLDQHDRAIRDGLWQVKQDFSFWLTPQIELDQKTLGIIGYGRIGRKVAQMALSFGMRVIVHSRSQLVEHPPSTNADGCTIVSLVELNQTSDVISLHCPATPETVGIINRAFLRRCQPHCFLINASRGALIVDADLAEALRQGWIAGAALDTHSQEPIDPQSPLLRAPRCLLTPHMAWASLAARKRLMQSTVENVASFQAGTPINVVNR